MKQESLLTGFHGGTSRTSTNKRHKKGKPLESDEKKIAVNVFENFSEKYPLLKINRIADLTSNSRFC
jgi:hypothetical protein